RISRAKRLLKNAARWPGSMTGLCCLGEAVYIGPHVISPLLPERANAIVVAAHANIGRFAAREQAIAYADALNAFLLRLPCGPVLGKVSAVQRPIKQPVQAANLANLGRVGIEVELACFE